MNEKSRSHNVNMSSREHSLTDYFSKLLHIQKITLTMQITLKLVGWLAKSQF